ncbi:4-hydroxy-tetrahydrodipicolinate reductase [Thalassobaculum sp. OXR-137]|uniref:4-hydroxy-tetrahydrodipicolinate reductase n=1 Tax=Thalassobaculum sp. OXR-137 TaxID=3100173 RepID=UPI002AC94EAA|nr:4-hydroxy-tetrahydrodipicolinate reductase [Thalassobaculum sp. OXR-137]WPZ37039.1 4-hydroxy-tetrahydrodipicolinate reductase [Thalassobaculum sp. OXR-137]
MAVGVFGSTGRMGRMVTRAVTEADGMTVKKAADRPGSAHLGADIGDLAGVGSLGVTVTDDVDAVLGVDVAIDFTLPEATLAHAARAAASGTPLVIGTTGLSNEQEAILAEHARNTAIVYAPNMSLGVNLLLAVVEQVSAALDEAWDIEIVEMHHNRKVDAPSGTALGLGRAAAKGRGRTFDDVAVLSREGHTGPREQGQIGFATLRGGDVIGDHTVIFAGAGERVEIGHKASGRDVFAAGAVRASRWVAGRAPGLYTMRDVLGLV